MQQKTYLIISSVIFLIVGVLHLCRALAGWEVVIGSFMVPVWASWIAFIVGGTLAYFGFKFTRS
ncbi:hypothetical protein A3A03_03800 [Candidatus Nomurabacteria bacterium RIFCSPLOWO2_01_FULL_40_18]|uniref:Uncharacterized protein n=1 Tax=Candidatus Nomurabacteria bacterium RIFCSPLOWO2_01_FULL_40_18 TaxID=1801773 RepID=A0A1F6XK68_9BACT|nr:MAG: hypothetical protein A3A03_03800 [Candidatus Nomurabacteria bacterium RIFCSPLOWO2_01_FULL_40_18]